MCSIQLAKILKITHLKYHNMEMHEEITGRLFYLTLYKHQIKAVII